jgi:isoleucyl-tRNA synthetase
VDGEGKKMSKSLGNYIPPDEVIDKNGAEIFRLWVSAEDYRDDIRLSKDILSRLVEAYRKFRNTFRFLLGNLYDFNPEKDAVDYSRLHFLDKWALNRLHELMGKIHSAYENYEFHVIFHAVKDFCAVDLSAFYLDIIKDRLYCSGKNSIERRCAQTAIYAILRNLVIAFSPILSFTCEEVYQHVPKKKGDPESVFMCDFPAPDCRSRDESIDGDFKYLIELREKALKEMELKRAQKEIGHPLDAHLKFRIKHGSLYFNIMKKYDDFLPSLFIVSQISFEETEKVNDETGIEVSVLRAEGNKCARCWNYSTSVGSDPVHSDCCSRCVSVLKNLQGFDLSNPRAR